MTSPSSTPPSRPESLEMTISDAPVGTTSAPTAPPRTSGMRHVALRVDNLDACLQFYTDLLGMQIEWQPDADNVFLTSGNDNLALHRAPAERPPAPDATARLDHIGFILDAIEDVDLWYAHLVAANVTIAQDPKTHRDGARSLYCYDPDGTLVQLIYHPPLAPTTPKKPTTPPSR